MSSNKPNGRPGTSVTTTSNVNTHGVDVKHNSYARYLAKKKGAGSARSGYYSSSSQASNRATALYGGNYVYENKIGIGAVVRLVRSGDVIPHILAVIMPAETAKMPNNVEWDWNETHVDIVLKDANQDETVTEKQIIAFLDR